MLNLADGWALDLHIWDLLGICDTMRHRGSQFPRGASIIIAVDRKNITVHLLTYQYLWYDLKGTRSEEIRSGVGIDDSCIAPPCDIRNCMCISEKGPRLCSIAHGLRRSFLVTGAASSRLGSRQRVL